MREHHDPFRDSDWWSGHRNGNPTRHFRRRCNKRSRQYARAYILTEMA